MAVVKNARPSRLGRWILRFPFFVYKLGLLGYERLFFGQHWLALTTKGRRTGKPHIVLLDVVGHDPGSGRYYVQPGWGDRSDWVLNVRACPQVTVEIDRKQFQGRVVDVSGREGAKAIYDFAAKHWVQAMWVGWLNPKLKPPSDTEADAIDWLSKHVLVFAIDPVDDATSPLSRIAREGA
jgi:deazaflavin-dependent oxidoreductase (nitroreductase family)